MELLEDSLEEIDPLYGDYDGSMLMGDTSRSSYNGTPPSRDGILMTEPSSSMSGAETAIVSLLWGGMAFARRHQIAGKGKGSEETAGNQAGDDDLQVTFMIHAATSFSDANGRVCVILPAEPIRRRTQRE